MGRMGGGTDVSLEPIKDCLMRKRKLVEKIIQCTFVEGNRKGEIKSGSRRIMQLEKQ